MPKRFTDTKIWDEDWFLELSRDNRDLWRWICDHCDIAGIWKPNITRAKMIINEKLNLEEFFNAVNSDKERVVKLENGRWFLTGFIPFQYGHKLSLGSPMHKSIYMLLVTNDVDLTSIRPQVEVRGSPKDKEKDKDRDKDNRQMTLNETVVNTSFKDFCEEIILFLNEKTGRRYDYTSKDTKGFLKARFNEGRTVEDVKLVVAWMSRKWKGDPKMDEYLRPSTLFRPKFSEYLAEARQKLEQGK